MSFSNCVICYCCVKLNVIDILIGYDLIFIFKLFKFLKLMEYREVCFIFMSI